MCNGAATYTVLYFLSARGITHCTSSNSYGVSVSCVDKRNQLPRFQASQWSTPYTQLTSFKYAFEIKLSRAVLELYTVSMWPKMLNKLVYSYSACRVQHRPAVEAGDTSCTLPPHSGLSLLM